MSDKDKPIGTKEAVAYFEDNIAYLRDGVARYKSMQTDGIAEIIAAHDLAIAALREKAARESTECEYCQDGKPLMDEEEDGVELRIYPDGELCADDYQGRPVSVMARFCPICGRRLTKDE